VIFKQFLTTQKQKNSRPPEENPEELIPNEIHEI